MRRFRAAWVSRGWSWDRRFDCAASTFSVSLVADAREAVTSAYRNEWNSKTLAKAPQVVQEVAERTGGVRSDQLILATDADRDLVSYALWWPWGGEGTNISLRVGIAGFATHDDLLDFRELFGVLDD